MRAEAAHGRFGTVKQKLEMAEGEHMSRCVATAVYKLEHPAAVQDEIDSESTSAGRGRGPIGSIRVSPSPFNLTSSGAQPLGRELAFRHGGSRPCRAEAHINRPRGRPLSAQPDPTRPRQG